MPISAVKTVAFIKIHHIRHIGQIVTWASHSGGAILDIDTIAAGYGGGSPGASRNNKRVDQGITRISIDALLRQIDINPMFTAANLSR